MPLWVSLSPGFPSGFPGENFIDNILDGLVNSMISFLKVVHTVAIPDSSTPLAISPTD
jgi:hypothetical protein